MNVSTWEIMGKWLKKCLFRHQTVIAFDIPQHLTKGHTHPKQCQDQIIGKGDQSSHVYAGERWDHPSDQVEHHIYTTIHQKNTCGTDRLCTLDTDSEQ